jgi:hypothetical protein
MQWLWGHLHHREGMPHPWRARTHGRYLVLRRLRRTTHERQDTRTAMSMRRGSEATRPAECRTLAGHDRMAARKNSITNQSVSTMEGLCRVMAAQEHPISISGIPPELIARKQWVMWKLVYRRGEEKPTKVPYSPNNYQPASSTDSETWGHYLQTLRSAQARKFDGIGYVFSADDPYVGIDLDGCYDPTTKTFSDTALKILAAVDSYAEFSQSGTGIHIIVKASLPAKGRRSDALGIEIYQESRYFIMTGRTIPGHTRVIEDCHEEVNTLYQEFFPALDDPQTSGGVSIPVVPSNLEDREIFDIATNAINGARFDALMRGDKSIDYFRNNTGSEKNEPSPRVCRDLMRVGNLL